MCCDEACPSSCRLHRGQGLTCFLAAVATVLVIFCGLLITAIIMQKNNQPKSPADLGNPVCIRDMKIIARQYVSEEVLSWLNDGATTQTTMRNNERAFSRVTLLPRPLVNQSSTDIFVTKQTILGQEVSIPIGISPLREKYRVTTFGESQVTRAAVSTDIVYISSATEAATNFAISDKTGVYWQQVILQEDRDKTAEVVRKSEENGAKALVVTIDRSVRPIIYSQSQQPISGLYTPRQDWDGIEWLLENTTLPIVLKGLLTNSDVIKAKQLGISAILLSNHGGRSVDGVSATIDVLPSVMKAVNSIGGGLEVYLDSGIRTGMDVFKALALGARMVFIGRPVLWGLAYGEQHGVEIVLDMLTRELINTAEMLRAPDVSSITKDYVKRRDELCQQDD